MEPTACECRRWKRKYMEAEHLRRKYVDQWDTDIHTLSSVLDDNEETIATLKSELKHAKTMNSSQRKVIQQLQDTLTRNEIPIKRTMMSLSNCRATDDEICPLSLMPINRSSLPRSDSRRPSALVLNPMKPGHKCAELVCGHRFNSLWLIYHFVKSNTFRCPVCLKGQDKFQFQYKELPPAVISMLDTIASSDKP